MGVRARSAVKVTDGCGKMVELEAITRGERCAVRH